MGGFRGSLSMSVCPACSGRAAQKPIGRVWLVFRLSRREESQHFFSTQTRAVCDPHRAPVPSGRADLWVLQELGKQVRPAARSLLPTPGPTLPCIWKSLVPLIFAFLSPVYLLEILFSLLKRRLCSPRGVCRGGSGFYNSAVSSTMFRKGEKRRTKLSRELQL